LALGFLNIPFQSIILDYDDEKTPIELAGSKMLPIIEFEGKNYQESLDIISLIDSENKLRANSDEITPLINKFGTNVHSLAMPYFIYTPEFNESSRKYFRAKKESYKGPFTELVAQRLQFEKALHTDLIDLEDKLGPFYQSPTFGLFDILIASHLWGMYIVPEFQFTNKVHDYLQSVKSLCSFEYHEYN
jgi:glutaredoxin 2